MAERSLFAIPAAPYVTRPADSRVLTCTSCGDQVEVFELPRPFLNPNAYVCGACLCDPEPRPAGGAA